MGFLKGEKRAKGAERTLEEIMTENLGSKNWKNWMLTSFLCGGQYGMVANSVNLEIGELILGLYADACCLYIGRVNPLN